MVRDKDGISALVAVLAAAVELHREGRTLLDLLAEIEEAIGRFDSDQVAVRVDDLAEIGAMTARLRAEPPAAIGGLRVAGRGGPGRGVGGRARHRRPPVPPGGRGAA